MPATTEVAVIVLKPGTDIEAEPTAGIIRELGETLQQQDGYQQMHTGIWIENPQSMQFFINWDSKASHEKFIASPTYGPLMDRLGTLLDPGHSPKIVHVDFQPPSGLTPVLSAPVTEIVTYFFSNAPPSNPGDGINKLLTAVREEGYGLLGWVYGTTYEEMEHEGTVGRAGMVALGWESVEEHVRARESKAFRERSGGFSSTAVGYEVHHVSFKNFA